MREEESLVKRIYHNFYEFFFIGLAVALYFIVTEYWRWDRMQMLEQPKINDFYFVDYQQIDQTSDRKFRYLPLKVTSIDNTHIRFAPARTGHSEPVNITTHVKFDAPMRHNFFQKDEISITREQVQDWAENGVLYDIARPEEIYINGWIVIGHRDIKRAEEEKAKLHSSQGSFLRKTVGSAQRV